MNFFSFAKNRMGGNAFAFSREQFMFWGMIFLGVALAVVVAWGSYFFYLIIISGEMQIVSTPKSAVLLEKEIDEVISSIEKREKLFHELLGE